MVELAKKQQELLTLSDASNMLAELTTLADKSSPTNSDVNKAQKILEEELLQNLTIAVQQYQFHKYLSEALKKNHNTLMDLSIQNAGEITEKDLAPYIKEATNKVSVKVDTEMALKLFLGDNLSYTASRDGDPIEFLNSRLKREDERHARYFEGKSKKEIEAEKLDDVSSDFYRFYLYQSKVEDKPDGLFSRDKSQREFIAFIKKQAHSYVDRARGYAAFYQDKTDNLIKGAVVKYQATGEITQALDKVVTTTLSREDDKNAFQKNLSAYYEALSSDEVKQLVGQQPAKIGSAVFTQRMKNKYSFVMNALRLSLTDANQINLNEESAVVGTLLSNALGKEYTVELLKDAIAYNQEVGKKISVMREESQASVKRYQDYITIIQNDPKFIVNDAAHSNTKALINYNSVVDQLDAIGGYSVEAITNYLNGDELAALIAPVKQDLFAQRRGHHINFLASFINTIQNARSHSKNPAVINEAFAVDQLAQATSPEFTKKLIDDICKASSDPALKSRLKDLAPVLDEYEPNAASNYAKLTFYTQEASNRKRSDVTLQIVQQGFVKDMGTTSRMRAMNRKASADNAESTPMNALYAQAKIGETELASVLSTLTAISANQDEANSYFKTLLELGKNDEAFVSLTRTYIGILADHDEATLKNLAQTQKTLGANFDAANIESINNFLASPELNNLPEDVQNLAINADTTGQILIGLIRDNGGDLVNHAKSFARIGELIKNTDTVQSAYKIVIEKVSNNEDVAKCYADYAAMLADEDSADKIELFAKLREDFYAKLEAKDGAALQSLLKKFTVETYGETAKGRLFTTESLASAGLAMLAQDNLDVVGETKALKTLTNFSNTNDVYAAIIEQTQDEGKTARYTDYVNILADEASAESIEAYAKLREDIYTAIASKDAAVLTKTISKYKSKPLSDAITANLFNAENLSAAANIMLTNSKGDYAATADALETLNGFESTQSIYENAVSAAGNDNDAYRMNKLVAMINQGRHTNLEQYAALDQDVQTLLAEKDIEGLRTLLTSDKVAEENISPDVVKDIVSQPLTNGETIPALIMAYKADNADEVAKNLEAVSGYLSDNERLETLQQRNADTGLNVFESMMADKDIYAQAEAVIAFNALMADDNDTRTALLQDYVGKMRERNTENGLERDTSEVQQYLAMVNTIALTTSNDDYDSEQKAAQIEKIGATLNAIKALAETNDADAFITFLKSDTFNNGIADYDTYSPNQLLKVYPSADNNAIDILFAQTNDDQAKELAFFSNIENIFKGNHITVDFYESLVAKHQDNPEKLARIQGYISAAMDGQLSTLINTKSLTTTIESAYTKPSLKKFRAIIESDEFKALDDTNRAEILSANIAKSDSALPLAAEIITRSTKNSEKLAEAVKFIGEQFEQSATSVNLFSQVAECFADNAALRAQFSEYANLYINNELEAMDSLAKVQNTIAKAVKDNDVATLAGLIEDESLKDLGSARREQILTSPMIGEKTLLTLLADNAGGDFDAEIKVFADTAKAIDDPELFDRLVNTTIESTSDEATVLRYRSYIELLNDSDTEGADAKVATVKAINSLLQNPKKITVEAIAEETDNFDGLTMHQTFETLNKATADGKTLFDLAMDNAKTPAAQAEAIIALSQIFGSEQDFTSSLTKNYVARLDLDETPSANLESRLKVMAEICYDSDYSEKDLTNFAKTLSEFDKAKEKQSFIAMSNILTTSAYKALPSSIRERFDAPSGYDNIFKAMLSFAENNPVQEAEIVADIINSCENQGDAYEKISELIGFSDNDAQIKRLSGYQKGLYAKYVRVNGDETIDPAQVSILESNDSWSYSYTITGKDGQTKRIDSSDAHKVISAANLVHVAPSTYFANNEIAYANYNHKKKEIEFFHNSHTDTQPKLELLKSSHSEALERLDALIKSGQFVSLPISGSDSVINMSRVEAAAYDSSKSTLTIEMRTGNRLIKKVDDSAARNMLRCLLDSGEYLADDDRRVFVRKDTIRALSFNASKETLSVKGDNRSFDLKNIPASRGEAILDGARASDMFIEDDKGAQLAKGKLAMIGYDDAKDQLLLALSKDEKYTRTVASANTAQNTISKFVATNNFIWRDAYSANNIARVESVEIDMALNTYALTLTSGATLTAEGVDRSNLQTYADILDKNPNITKTSSGEYEVAVQSNVKPLIIAKSSLTTQFNAAAVVSDLVNQVGAERVQSAINASAAWLDAMHAKELDQDDNKKMQALGALLLNAYSLHTDIPESVMVSVANDQPEKPRVRASSKSALSMLQESFNNAANGGGDAGKVHNITTVANDLGRKNQVMQYYQQALDTLAVK